MSFHKQYERSIPEKKPPGHQPAAPRYTLRWNKPVSMITCCYFGMQKADLHKDEEEAFVALARRSFGEPSGPEAFEFFRFEDLAGERNAVAVAYWLQPSRHAEWSSVSELSKWFASSERVVGGDAGYWRETISVPYDRHETLYSASGYRVGLGRTNDCDTEVSIYNGYFGAARDRVPLSAIDPLVGTTPKSLRVRRNVQSRGRRLHVRTPLNMTVLRSGQYWENAVGDQLVDYETEMLPRLTTGMHYLTENPTETSTLSLRTMTNIGLDLQSRRETSVLAYFSSLAGLETWAKSHESHLNIYRHAIAMNRKFGTARTVVTWHEMFVMLEGYSFEYANCHGQTGLLPYFDLYEAFSLS